MGKEELLRGEAELGDDVEVFGQGDLGGTVEDGGRGVEEVGLVGGDWSGGAGGEAGGEDREGDELVRDDEEGGVGGLQRFYLGNADLVWAETSGGDELNVGVGAGDLTRGHVGKDGGKKKEQEEQEGRADMEREGGVFARREEGGGEWRGHGWTEGGGGGEG